MGLTRIAHGLIVVIIAIAAVAIFLVVRPDSAHQNPSITLDEVINYAKFGVVESVEVKDNVAIVTFSDDYDPSTGPLATESRVFEMTVPDGENVAARLLEAGVPVGADGVSVTQ
jgi:hypothetical protein